MADAQLVGTIGIPPYATPAAGVINLLAATVRMAVAPSLVKGPGALSVALGAGSTDSLGRVSFSLGGVAGLLLASLSFSQPFSGIPVVLVQAEGPTLVQLQPLAVSAAGFQIQSFSKSITGVFTYYVFPIP